MRGVDHIFGSSRIFTRLQALFNRTWNSCHRAIRQRESIPLQSQAFLRSALEDNVQDCASSQRIQWCFIVECDPGEEAFGSA